MAKTLKAPDAQVMTANRLRDGAVVYLAAADQWSTEIAEGVVARDPAAAERLTVAGNKAAADQVVVAPYLIAVTVKDNSVEALGTRERIRALGPSVSERPERPAA